MYQSFRHLEQLTLQGADDRLGDIEDLYFDDREWVVRYLVVDTGSWLRDQLVLISPTSIQTVDPEKGLVQVNLTAEQIEKGPAVDTTKPISRQAEEELAGYYSWPMYWGPAGYFHNTVNVRPPVPENPGESEEDFPKEATLKTDHDPNLRSVDEVRGYQIATMDDPIGHVADFILETEDWRVAYLEIDTGTWLPGKKVLVSPRWIQWISWDDSQVGVELLREAIKSSPEHDPDKPLTEAYIRSLHEHYGYEDNES